MARHGGRQGSTGEYVAALRALLDEVVEQDAWLRSIQAGPVSSVPQMATPAQTGHGTGGERHARHTGGSASDPTAAQAVRDRAAQKRAKLHRDVQFLFEKAAEIHDRAILTEQLPRASDSRGEFGPVDEESGASAYRGDRRAPAPPSSAAIGRPDLQDALDAQRRRLDRGMGWGEA